MRKKLALAGLLVLACALPALAYSNVQRDTDVAWAIAGDEQGNANSVYGFSRGRLYQSDCEHFTFGQPYHIEGDDTQIWCGVSTESAANPIYRVTAEAAYEYNSWSGYPEWPDVTDLRHIAIHQSFEHPAAGDEFYIYAGESVPSPEHSGSMKLTNYIGFDTLSWYNGNTTSRWMYPDFSF